jgi:hypothetical protein
METENRKKSTIIRTIFWILCSLLLLFMIYYAAMALLSPGRKINDINNKYNYKEPDNSKTDKRIFSDSAFVSVNQEKSFYQARVLMAESDSICLALNLSDSTAILEIEGVAVHKAKISEITVSKVFRKADEYSVTSMRAIPFIIMNDYSTFRKEPVMIKLAPKDTSEYKPDILPDTTSSEPVNYIFEMVNGTRLYVYQDLGENRSDRIAHYMFDLKDRLRSFRHNLKSIINLKVPEYHPAIRISLAKADAKIIYRALPKHGLVSVFW